MNTFVNKIRERINLKLYNSKNLVLGIFRILLILFTISAIGAIVYYYGFPQTSETKELLLNYFKVVFGFYVLHYITQIIYDFSPLQFIKKTWFQAIMMLLLILEGLHNEIFGHMLLPTLFERLGMHNAADYTGVFIHIYFLITIISELGKPSQILTKIKLDPSVIFTLTFILIILSGTGLLMLPEMTTIKGSMNFLDALFTSTSAVCVTGLIVEDTATFFTFKGQLILMALIKIGGLNILIFSTLMAFAAKFGISVKHHNVIEDFVNKDSMFGTGGMLRNIILWSIGFELLGAVLMYFLWSDHIPFRNSGQKIFYSLFHSVSAFNNAGFSIFTDGFGNPLVQHNYGVHWILSVLIFLGALGFVPIFDIFEPRAILNRYVNKWKSFKIDTRIALYYSLGLIVFGAVLFFALEYNNTLKDQSLYGKITGAVFQSVTTRTAGFNTVDIGAMTIPMLIMFLVLMFIGASSSSTGGGIKTSTFAIIWAATVATIKNNERTELFKRTIPVELVKRAYSIFIFFIFGIVVSVFLLSITETEILNTAGRSVLDLIFEEVSAICTVGLSTGITSQLSEAGKAIIIASMFIGRVGTLTIAFAVSKRVISLNYKYPKAHMLVG
tara:strand:- start:14148 stop:15983 length:1836 start_codon:yes stop_codon:yes gene_type:complete